MTSLLLSPQAAAAKLLARRQARRQLIDFTTYTNHKYEAAKHHKVIAAALDDVLAGKVDRLQLKIPPRHGKSELASRRFPAYALGHNPDWQVISASATMTLAEDFGRDVRNLMKSEEYARLFPDSQLSDDSQARGRWSTSAGGIYYAIGVGGSIMGRGGDLIVIDDPFSSWEDAQSEISRKNVWEWYTNTIYNRLQPGGRIVVINHRMHEDDLCGRLDYDEAHGGDKWTRVSLPAVTSQGALWPERYGTDALERIKRVTMPRAWSALYQQEPTADQGTYFRRESFKRYVDAPTILNIYMTGDFAVSEDKGDYTFLIVWGVDQFKNCYVLAIWFGQKTVDVWIRELLDRVETYAPLRFVGESGVIKKSIEPFLLEAMTQRGIYVSCEWLPTNADKPALARSFQGLCEMGRVYLPMTNDAEQLIDQCVAFPGGKFDDGVDACSIFGRFIANTWKSEPDEVPTEIAWNQPITMGEMISGHR